MKKALINPVSEDHARGQVTALLKGTFHRSRPADANLIQFLAAEVAASIWRQFGIGPFQWEAKHLRWFLCHGTACLSLEDRQVYYTTVQQVSEALGKWLRWEKELSSGSWVPLMAAADQPHGLLPAS